MKTCPVSSKCQWGHCMYQNTCGLNNDEYCKKLAEELEVYFYKMAEGVKEDEQEPVRK